MTQDTATAGQATAHAPPAPFPENSPCIHPDVVALANLARSALDKEFTRLWPLMPVDTRREAIAARGLVEDAANAMDALVDFRP